MVLQILSTPVQKGGKSFKVTFSIFALILQSFVPLNVPAAFALSQPTVARTSLTIEGSNPISTETSLVNGIGFENLKLSFDYNAEYLDNSESLRYGWRLVGGANSELGHIQGKNENGANKATDETGSVQNVNLPHSVNDKEFELYFTNTGTTATSGSISDAVYITNITVSGDEIPVVEPVLEAQDFATWDNSPAFKGFSVGFAAHNFGNVTSVTVDVKRADDSHVVRTAGSDTLALLSNVTVPTSASAPFVVAPGDSDGLADSGWWSGQTDAVWTESTIPVSATIIVEGEHGTRDITNTNLLAGDSPARPSYQSMIPAPIVSEEDTEKPLAPIIQTPSNEHYFASAPILMEWSASTDNIGVEKYQVAYRYDDSHTFSGSTCSGLTIGGELVSGCRDTTSTSRNHQPGESEQGGVWVWVRAFDAAGNGSDWSTPVHYYYDTTDPELAISNLGENDAIRTNNAGGKLTIEGEFTDNVQISNAVFYLIKDGALIDMQILQEEKPAGSTLAMFDTTALGITSGEYELRANAFDRAGNTHSQTIHFVLDNDAPMVEITTPSNGTVFDDAVPIRGTVIDSHPRHYFLQIKRDGVVVHSQTVMMQESFTDQVIHTVSEEGEYEVLLAARDAVGGTSSSGNRSGDVRVSFTIDKTDSSEDDQNEERPVQVIIPPNENLSPAPLPANQPTGDSTGGNEPIAVTQNTSAQPDLAAQQLITSPVVGSNEEASRSQSSTSTENESEILGEQGSAGTPLEDTEVLGSMDEKIFGLVWYWWLVLLGGIVGGWLLLAAAIRRSRARE